MFGLPHAWVATLAINGLLTATTVLAAELPKLTIMVSAGSIDRAAGTPVKLLLTLPKSVADGEVRLVSADGAMTLDGQLTPVGLYTQMRLTKSEEAWQADQNLKELHFLSPAMKAGSTLTLQLREPLQRPDSTTSLEWKVSAPDVSVDLVLGKRPVLRYMHEKLDNSSKEARERTYKPYHHVFAADGRMITKGPGGKFPHHRGLFYGFNRITYGDGKKADTWHCTGDAHQSHQRIVSAIAGRVLGRHTVEIFWHGPGGEVFARELREMTAYVLPEGTLVDFASVLRVADAGPVRLDGDPQHAGFQFRADNEVSDKTAKQTYYLRTDGRGKPGETRNWEPKTKKGPVDLPWNAVSFVLGETRYTVAILDRFDNPKEARFSERDYGRFGSYFEYDLTADRPLMLHYRVWVQVGETTTENIARMTNDFVNPPSVKVE